jgi:hypothetical protein
LQASNCRFRQRNDKASGSKSQWRRRIVPGLWRRW